MLENGKEKTDEELAEEYYYKTFPVTLNIGEEERKEKVMEIFLAGLNTADVKSREEQIEALEKKVGKLEFSLENKIADYDKLERENEMFKKANEIIAQQRDDRDANISLLENRNDELESQNSKAKELLKKAIKCTWSIDCFVVDEINEFLKE